MGVKSVEEYFAKTESAVRILFNGICVYTELLRGIQRPVFVSGHLDEKKLTPEFSAWEKANSAEIEAVRKAEEKFFAESFALATLCGSLLQVASKAIEMFSKNTDVDEKIKSIVTIKDQRGRFKINHKVKRFCIGRRVNDVPIGLIIYAGRNQHMHCDAEELSEVNLRVFGMLAMVPGYQEYRDPAFDLCTKRLDSYASNITALLAWRSYSAYFNDMNALFGLGEVEAP